MELYLCICHLSEVLLVVNNLYDIIMMNCANLTVGGKMTKTYYIILYYIGDGWVDGGPRGVRIKLGIRLNEWADRWEEIRMTHICR